MLHFIALHGWTGLALCLSLVYCIASLAHEGYQVHPAPQNPTYAVALALPSAIYFLLISWMNPVTRNKPFTFPPHVHPVLALVSLMTHILAAYMCIASAVSVAIALAVGGRETPIQRQVDWLPMAYVMEGSFWALGVYHALYALGLAGFMFSSVWYPKRSDERIPEHIEQAKMVLLEPRSEMSRRGTRYLGIFLRCAGVLVALLHLILPLTLSAAPIWQRHDGPNTMLHMAFVLCAISPLSRYTSAHLVAPLLLGVSISGAELYLVVRDIARETYWPYALVSDVFTNGTTRDLGGYFYSDASDEFQYAFVELGIASSALCALGVWIGVALTWYHASIAMGLAFE